VSQKQKKIDIDIPKLNAFVHKCYIMYARKLYSNVYLFEKDILPLNYQKNMREAELMCQESILNVIRENMPVENILRAYIDETVDEEIIEETIEKTVDEAVKKAMEEEAVVTESAEKDENNITKTEDTIELEKPELEKNKVVEEALKNEKLEAKSEVNKEEKSKEHNIKLTIATPVQNTEETPKETPKEDVVSSLKFNDTDSVVNYDKKASPSSNPEPEKIEAPKTVERLEKISKEANERRKAEEEEEDDYDDEKLTIFDDAKLELDNIDVHSLDKKLNLEPDPILNDIEVLG
jgi:hypothetical protein